MVSMEPLRGRCVGTRLRAQVDTQHTTSGDSNGGCRAVVHVQTRLRGALPAPRAQRGHAAAALAQQWLARSPHACPRAGWRSAGRCTSGCGARRAARAGGLVIRAWRATHLPVRKYARRVLSEELQVEAKPRCRHGHGGNPFQSKSVSSNRSISSVGKKIIQNSKAGSGFDTISFQRPHDDARLDALSAARGSQEAAADPPTRGARSERPNCSTARQAWRALALRARAHRARCAH